MMEKKLTRERLRELLDYNYFTGIFTWRVSRGRAKAGSVAGKVNHNGYIHIKIDTVDYQAHRLAFLWMKRWPVKEVLHSDGKRGDNRWHVLKEGTSADNAKDKKVRSDNTSGVTGVGWIKSCQRWSAGIMVNHKRIHLGTFINKADAVTARKVAELEHGFISRPR